MEYLHLFKTKTEHDSFYNGNKYKEPWLAYTRDNTLVTGNKSYDYYRNEYLTLTAIDNGEITITIPNTIDQNYATSLSYSKDKSTWTETVVDNTNQTITIQVSNGDNVYLKGIAKQFSKQYSNCVIDSTAVINASGNIMSLLYGDDFKDKTSLPEGSQYAFGYLFYGNNHLINAKNLILPATRLASYCYQYMFGYCSSLTTAPELPATTLANSCYSSMFRGCTSLTTAPELPATTLADGCYVAMFGGCTSLTTAPELPATALADGCYSSMFSSCTLINSITMLATNISASGCLNNWVYGVASTGTFTKSPEMTSLPTGTSGIPSGWTVVNK